MTAMHVAAIHGNQAVIDVLREFDFYDLPDENGIRPSDLFPQGNFTPPSRVNEAWDTFAMFRATTHRTHRFSPGVSGRELLRDAERVVQLGYWNLFDTGKVDPATIGPKHLHEEVRQNNIERVRLMADKYGVDVNAPMFDGWTALHAAMARGNECMVRLLRELGAKDKPAEDGIRPSMLYPELWRHMEFGIDLPGAVDSTVAAFVFMLRQNVKRTIRTFTDNIFNGVPTRVLASTLRTLIADAGVGILFQQAAVNRPDGIIDSIASAPSSTLLRIAMEFGADVTDNRRQYIYGGSSYHESLLFAGITSSPHTVRLLLEAGLDPDEPNDRGIPPLEYAISVERYEQIRLLAEYGADVNAMVRNAYPLVYRVYYRGIRMLALVHELGADLRVTDVNGDTMVHKAVDDGALEILKFLLDAGLDINARNNSNETPLQVALSAEKEPPETHRVLEVLLEYNVDIAPTDEFDPLVSAVLRNDIVSVRLLLDHGADPNARDANGGTPLHIAAEECHSRTILELLKGGADATLRDGEGRTPAQVQESRPRPNNDLVGVLTQAQTDPAAAIENLTAVLD